MILPGESGPSKAEIEACSDAATLALWYRDMVEAIESIKAQVYGHRLTGQTDPDWAARAGRKAGYFRMSARWVELRLLSLDLPVPYLPSDPRQAELRRNAARIKVLSDALVAAGVPLPGREAVDG